MKQHDSRHIAPLETIWVTVEQSHVALFEQAFATICQTVGFFEANPEGTLWRVEGVREASCDDETFDNALALARLITGEEAPLHRESVASQGWLAKNRRDFTPVKIGRHFLICPTHYAGRIKTQRFKLIMDAGMAFGSGEHATTQGCIEALEWIVTHRQPQHILDMGCGSGILAMAAARLTHKKVLAVDTDPWAIYATQLNCQQNRLRGAISTIVGTGWASPLLKRKAPFDLIFANILARPLCLMASHIRHNLAPGGYAILSGLLTRQIPMVANAYRHNGLKRIKTIIKGSWATLIVKAPHFSWYGE